MGKIIKILIIFLTSIFAINIVNAYTVGGFICEGITGAGICDAPACNDVTVLPYETGEWMPGPPGCLGGFGPTAVIIHSDPGFCGPLAGPLGECVEVTGSGDVFFCPSATMIGGDVDFLVHCVCLSGPSCDYAAYLDLGSPFFGLGGGGEPPIPEFSTIGILFAIILGVIGILLVIISKKK